MSARKLAIGLVALGLLTGAFIGRTAAGVEDPPMEHQAIPITFRSPAFITITGEAGERVTVANPRAASGQVFYITDIVATIPQTDAIQVFFPPELGQSDQILAYFSHPLYLQRSFATPIPLIMTIDVKMPDNAPSGGRRITFSGFYSSVQPNITSVDGNP